MSQDQEDYCDLEAMIAAAPPRELPGAMRHRLRGEMASAPSARTRQPWRIGSLAAAAAVAVLGGYSALQLTPSQTAPTIATQPMAPPVAASPTLPIEPALVSQSFGLGHRTIQPAGANTGIIGDINLHYGLDHYQYRDPETGALIIIEIPRRHLEFSPLQAD